MYTFIYIYVCICTYTYTSIYVGIYTHTYIFLVKGRCTRATVLLKIIVASLNENGTHQIPNTVT